MPKVKAGLEMSIVDILNLSGKVVIVTGGGAGLGKAIAFSFAQAGADLVIAEINPQSAGEVASEIHALGRKALAVSVDVRDNKQVDNMVNRTLAEFGKIDVLVNNAGGHAPGTRSRHNVAITELTEESWDEVMTLNIKTTFLCCRAIGRVMKTQKSGCIINISSIAAFGPYPGSAAYAAAKSGVISLTQALAFELGPFNIRVNAIAPGAFKTPLFEEGVRLNPRPMAERLKRVPLGRWGRVEEVGRVATFLASAASEYVTGETIRVTGGVDSFIVPPVSDEGFVPDFSGKAAKEGS